MSSRKDIIFVAPPLVWGEKNKVDFKPPVNLVYLASYINSRGFKAEIIDVPPLQLSVQEIVNRIRSEQPAYVGIPFYHASLDTALALCRELKHSLPDVGIIGGGPSMTVSPEYLMSGLLIDVGVVGEGERAVEAILLKNSRDFSDIPGAVFWQGENIIINERNHIEDLDALPFLDYSLVDMKPYFENQDSLKIPKTAFLTTSRGCNFRCTYCSTPQLWPGKIRRYSAKRVVDEIGNLTDTFPGICIGFLDDSFFLGKDWLKDYFREIRRVNVKYNCIGRADHLDEEIICQLARTGCQYVALGVETGSAERQRKIKKHLNIEKVRENVRILVKNGIHTKCFFMIGFPDETPAEMAETVNLAADLRKTGMFKFNIFPVVLYPGTELAKGFDESLFSSTVYVHEDDRSSGNDDFGEKIITQYSTIPKIKINKYFDQYEIIAITKYAYNKVENREYITVEEIESFKGTC